MICHHYRCLFVHIPKTAGQSIEHAFLGQLGLSWQTRASLLLYPNSDPRLGPPRLAHLKLREYLRYQYLSQDLFDEYFKFSIVRDPWDRAVSIYKYSEYNMPFKKFLFDVLAKRLWADDYWFVGPQHEFICDESGEVGVDYVGRFETLERDFSEISGIIGLHRKIDHVNKSYGRKRQLARRVKQLVDGVKNADLPKLGSIFMRKEYFPDYSMYYDQEAIELVGDLYKRDIEIFGYERPVETGG